MVNVAGRIVNMRFLTVSSATFVALIGFIGGALAACPSDPNLSRSPRVSSQCTDTQSGGRGSAGGGGQPLTTRVCAGQARDGWVIIDTQTGSLAGCPSGENNIWVVEQVGNLPVGTTVLVCAGQAPPAGWQIIGGATEYARCEGFGSGQNVRTIERT